MLAPWPTVDNGLIDAQAEAEMGADYESDPRSISERRLGLIRRKVEAIFSNSRPPTGSG